MVYGAIDLHMRYSQIRIVDADGQVVREQRVRDDAERLVAVFAGSGRCGSWSRRGRRVSGWPRCSRRPGTMVIVADPNYAPMYGECRRKVKTDRRDVAALAEANRRGLVSRHASGVGGAARGAASVAQPAAVGADAIRDHLR